MPRWLIPIVLVEYGHEAIIEAETRTEAIAKLRRCEWEELTDANRFKVTKVGAAKKEE